MRYSIHICALDATCREYWNVEVEGWPRKPWWQRTPPTRVALHGPSWSLDLALLPWDWFARRDGNARPWSFDRAQDEDA